MTENKSKKETKPKKPVAKKSANLQKPTPYCNEYGHFKAGNPGRPFGAKGKVPGFRKALLEAFTRTGGVDGLVNYLTQQVEVKNGKAKSKYNQDADGLAKLLNTPRYEFLLGMLAKTTPKTEMEDDGEDGNSYEARMKKVDDQLESNPTLKDKLLEELVDEA